jgi:hypothetical protein
VDTRQIKGSYRSSPRLRKLSRDAYFALPHSYCLGDNFGIFIIDPITNRNQAFPARDDITVEDFEKWLREWAKVKQLEVFKVNGIKYGFFTGWFKHNRLRLQTPLHPRPPSLHQHISKEEWFNVDEKAFGRLRQAAADCGKLPPKRREEKGREEKGSTAVPLRGQGTSKSTAKPPRTLREIQARAAKRQKEGK